MSREKATLSRAHWTKWLIDTLREENWPVGDNDVPNVAYGWQGTPNIDNSNFIPWMSVGTGTARPTGGSFGDSASEHTMSYSVTYNGVNREQIEVLADKMRKVFVNSTRLVLDCGVYGSWKIVQVQEVSIGGVQRIRTPDPDYFIQTDAFDIWVSKERS